MSMHSISNFFRPTASVSKYLNKSNTSDAKLDRAKNILDQKIIKIMCELQFIRNCEICMVNQSSPVELYKDSRENMPDLKEMNTRAHLLMNMNSVTPTKIAHALFNRGAELSKKIAKYSGYAESIDTIRRNHSTAEINRKAIPARSPITKISEKNIIQQEKALRNFTALIKKLKSQALTPNDQGVFRVPGIKTEMDHIANIFKSGSSSEIADMLKSECRIHTLCGAIKEQFRLTLNEADKRQLRDLAIATRDNNGILPVLKAPLPKALQTLLPILNRISGDPELLMDSSNLAQAFAPHINSKPISPPADYQRSPAEIALGERTTVELYTTGLNKLLMSALIDASKPLVRPESTHTEV